MRGNISRKFWIKLWCIGSQRFLDGEYRLKHRVGYVNQLHCFQSNILCLGNYQGNCISDEADILIHNMMMLRRGKTVCDVNIRVHILPGHNGSNSGISLGLFNVNGFDFGIGMGAS